jgi:hypothetical protein
MNLKRVPDRKAEDIHSLVESELRKITDSSILQGLNRFLTIPRVEMRTWEWDKKGAKYPVWIVAESQQYDYGIAFSDYGFAPEYAWGLVFLSRSNFDADYCWYSTLEQAYRESRLLEVYEQMQRSRTDP